MLYNGLSYEYAANTYDRDIRTYDLEHKDEKIYVPDSAQTLNEFKNLARDWNIYLKQRFIDKRKFEIEKDFYKDEDDVSESDVQEEKDSSDKPLPIHKRFAKWFKKDSK